MTDAPAEVRRPRAVLLRAAFAAWKRIAHAIGNFQVRVILTVVYFVVVAPFALMARRRRDEPTRWRDLPDAPVTIEGLRKQF